MVDKIIGKILQEFCHIFDISIMMLMADLAIQEEIIPSILDSFISDVILEKIGIPTVKVTADMEDSIPNQYLVVDPSLYKAAKVKMKRRRRSTEAKEQAAKKLNVKKKDFSRLIYNGINTLAPPTPTGLDSGFTSVQNSRRTNIESTLISNRDGGSLDLSFFERCLFGKRLATKD